MSADHLGEARHAMKTATPAKRIASAPPGECVRGCVGGGWVIDKFIELGWVRLGLVGGLLGCCLVWCLVGYLSWVMWS